MNNMKVINARQERISHNCKNTKENLFNYLKPTGYVMHQQFNIQQLYALPHTVLMCFVFI